MINEIPTGTEIAVYYHPELNPNNEFVLGAPLDDITIAQAHELRVDVWEAVLLAPFYSIYPPGEEPQAAELVEVQDAPATDPETPQPETDVPHEGAGDTDQAGQPQADAVTETVSAS